MSRNFLFAYALVLAAGSPALTQSKTPVPAAKKPALAQQHQEEGQRIFEQNCSRCHTTPDGFSPHISGTIVMHMRVRASLSEHDAKAVLRFFNP
jgi:mono/diheme cytochrome c family protein